MTAGDENFCAEAARRLAELPGVLAVSRRVAGAGNARPDSDWDFAVYYRGADSTRQSLRSLGWPGKIFPIGGWGGGVFNSGAWLIAGDRRVDVHYRDLDDIDHRLAEAQAGRFRIERLMFHLAGVPTYIVLAELAGHRVLHGDLPRPDYPPALREAAARAWQAEALATLNYAQRAHAARGHPDRHGGGDRHRRLPGRARGAGGPRRVDHQRQAAARPGRAARRGRDPGRAHRRATVTGGGGGCPGNGPC